MPCDTACLGIFCVVIADNQSVNGEGILFTGDLLGEGSDTVFYRMLVGMLHLFMLYGMEPLSFQPVHAVAP